MILYMFNFAKTILEVPRFCKSWT